MLRVIRQSPLVQYSAAFVLLMALMLFAVPGLRQNLLATGAGGDAFMTHYHCYLEIGSLVRLHYFSDLLIGFSYVAISLTLAYLVNRARRDIPFHWVFLAFGVFIIACGSTHFMEAWTTYHSPVYWLAGYLKLVTAVASVGTAIVLPPLVPRTLALVRDAKLSERRRLELEAANRQLEAFYRRAKELKEVKTRALAGEAQDGGGARAAAQMPLPLSRLERLALAPLVLVAGDDAETSRRVAESVCENCRVESARGGREALERARSVEPDLIVCDAASAGMKGEEFVRAVRAEGRLRDVPVMMLAAGDEAERVRLLREGAQDYMTKPFVGEELRARAENLIEIKLTRELLQHELASQSRDLTDLAREVASRRRELEQTVGELRESNFKLEAIIKASPLAIVALDPEGLVRSWNPAAERIYGWSQGEVLGKPLPTVPHDRRDEMERNHRAAVAGTIFSDYETTRVRKDGSTVEVSISTSPLLGEGGEHAGVVALVADVTERKRAEAALAAQSATLREQSEVIEYAYDAIILRDPSNAITLWNKGAERTYGFTKDDALGRSPHELLQTETPVPLEEIYASLRREGYWEGELTHTRKDGGKIVVESRWATVRDERGGLSSILEINRDITERKRAEDALRESEERYRAFVAQSSEAIWRIEFADPIPVNLPEEEQIERYYAEGYLAECNDVMARMYGFSRAEELHGSRLGDMLPRTEENMAYLRDAIRAGYRLTDAESQELDRDGNAKYFLNNLVGIVEGGLLRRVWGTQRDVTERKRAEVEVIESRRELQIVTDSAPVFIASCDRDARYVFVNEPFAARLGLRREEVVGKRIPEVLGEEAYAAFRHHVEAALSGRRVEFESEVPYRGIGRRFMHATYVPRRDEAGAVQGFVAVIADVTERREEEEEEKFLSDATTVLASSLDHAATLEAVARMSAHYLSDYCLVDLVEDDGRVTRLVAAHRDPKREEAWREMQRRFPVEPESRHTVVKVLHTGEPDLLTELTDDVLDEAIPEAEHREMLRRLGVASAMTVPLRARGRTLGALTFVSAESARRYTERELRVAEELARRAALAVDNARLFERAQEANRAKDEFLATLSHELRTPLTPIVGWVHLLGGDGVEPAEFRHGLDVIDKNSQALSRLINDLLDMSAILNGKMRIDRAPLRLDSVLQEAVETVRAQADKRGVRVELSPCGGEDGAQVEGDRTRLVQVFWNLLSNAVKFSADGALVRISCARDASALRVAVEDEGIGIAPEFLPHVFDRFRQADMSTTKLYGGLGIGLSLVRSFVEAHGGTVRAESAGAGRGSRFTVTLPQAASGVGGRGIGVGEKATERAASKPAAVATEGAAVETTRAASESAPNPQPPTPNPRHALRVLVVEDAPDTLELLRLFLAARGYEPVLCPSAEEALDVASRQHFDIILSDIGLPHTDGYELLSKLRQTSPSLAHAPALALSGYAAEADVEAARAAGFDAHLAKPFEPAALAAALDELLSRGAQTRREESPGGDAPC